MSRLFVGCLVAGAAARVARANATEGPGDGGTSATDEVLPEVHVPLRGVLPEEARDPKDETGQLTRVDARAYAGEGVSTAELIATAPGAQIHRLGDQGQLATVALRGSSTDQVLVLLDGIPLTSAAGGSVDLSTIPAGLIDHLDVLRGDAAAFYGSSALGGVVNVVTRRAGAHQGEAEVSYGSWGAVSANAADGVEFNTKAGPVSASLGLSLYRSDGNYPYQYNPTPDLSGTTETLIRQNNQSVVLGGLGAVSAPLGGGNLDAVIQGSYADRGLAGSEFAATLHDHDTDGLGLLGVSWTRPLVGTFELTALAQARADSLDVSQVAYGHVDQLDVEAGGQLGLAGTLGFQRLSLSVSGSDEVLTASTVSPARGSFGASIADRFSFFGEKLLVIPVVRVDEVGQFFGVSPKLGVSVFPLPPLELRANGGTGFRAPTFGELYLQQGIAQPNPALTPETNQSVDFGATLRVGRLWLSASAFYSHYDNLILYELYPPMEAKPFNEGSSNIRGFESEALARPLPGLELAVSYSFLDAVDDDATSYTYGRELPYKPQNHGRGRVAWSHGRVSARVDLDLSSSQYLNHAATLTIPGHALLDASIALRVVDRPAAVWIATGGRNLLDSQAPDSFGYPLPSTSFYLSLRASEATQGAPQ